jgi:hypothetical protein
VNPRSGQQLSVTPPPVVTAVQLGELAIAVLLSPTLAVTELL